MAAGIEARKRRGRTVYRAVVYDRSTAKRLSKTFDTLAGAKQWRADAIAALNAGRLSGDRGPTVANAFEQWLDGARRPHPQSLRRSLQAIGHPRLRTERAAAHPARPRDRQARRPSPPAPTGVRRRARRQRCRARNGDDDDAAAARDLPARARPRHRRGQPDAGDRNARGPISPGPDRKPARGGGAASRAGAPRPAPVGHRPVRRAQARRANRAALGGRRPRHGTIRVERGWDHLEGEIAPKSREGWRTVPTPVVLRDYLLEHRMREGGDPCGRVFDGPAAVRANIDRARERWAACGLAPLTLHEARHTYASFAIAAGVNAKALSTYMGHANIGITLDLYGHLMPGNEAQAASLLDVFLGGAEAGTSPETSPDAANVPS